MLGTLSHSLRHENAKLDALTHTHVCTRQSKAECEKKTWASDTYVRYVMLRAHDRRSAKRFGQLVEIITILPRIK